MRLKIELNGCGISVNLVVGVNDGANGRIERCGMSGNDGYVTTHYLNVAEIHLKNAILSGNKALGTDTYVNSTVIYAGS